jgi:hypothetical protein
MSSLNHEAQAGIDAAEVAHSIASHLSGATPIDVLTIKRMYNRYLQQWALDALALRRQGLDRPGMRRAIDANPARPGRVSPASRRAA